jgi:hypothetical protein
LNRHLDTAAAFERFSRSISLTKSSVISSKMSTEKSVVDAAEDFFDSSVCILNRRETGVDSK